VKGEKSLHAYFQRAFLPGLLLVYNEDFLNLYTSPNIIPVMKSRTVTFAGNVAHTENYKFVQLFYRKT
jgi:hypothetical protein